VPDERFRWLMDLYKPKSGVPAFLEASAGELLESKPSHP
jgi:hypothetical protein